LAGRERGRESAELKPPWTPLCSVEGGREGWWDQGGTKEGRAMRVEKREKEVAEQDPPLVG
jgi:hypothetical protein